MEFTAGHALVIGVGSYKHDSTMNAPQTVADAEQVAAILRDAQFCGYPVDQVTLLRREEATRARILDELDRLTQITQGKPDATVLLFYSGHGVGNAALYCLTTHDIQVDASGKVIPQSGVLHTELLEKVRNIPAQRMLLIFNACHSGAMAPKVLGEQGERPLPDDVATALLATGEGRVIINACREQQFSYFDGQEPTTIFASVLADGLRGKDIPDRRGYISVFDLYAYVYDTVSSTVRHRWNVTQEPELTVSKGVGIMAVALRQGATAKGTLGSDDAPTVRRGQIREIDYTESQRVFEQLMTGNITIAAEGDVKDNTFVGRDQYHLQQSHQPIINPRGPVNQRNINTAGGTYVEGSQDNREGIFGGTFQGPAFGVVKGGDVDARTTKGDTINMTGNTITNSNITIKSNLDNVTQTIASAPHLHQTDKDALTKLIEQVKVALQQVPAGHEDDVEAVVDTAKELVERATAQKPNKTKVTILAEGLKQAAQTLISVVPSLLPLVQQITDVIARIVG